MTKSSDYTQELSKNQIKDLQSRFVPYLKRSKRSGFLPTETKKRLLHLTNWEKDTSNQEIYQFFSDVREHALSGMMDLQLLCRTLNEKELKRIFGTKPTASDDYPITKVLLFLLPESRTFRMKPKEIEKLQKEQEWRKVILNELVLESLYWYFYSGLFETDAHARLLADTMDAISVLSGGDHKIQTNYEVNLSRLAF